MTFIQANELGAHVRKGEKGFLVVKYGTFTKIEEAAPAPIPETSGEESIGGLSGPLPELRKRLTTF